MGMTIDELKCIIGEYKLRIPPTVYYELLTDLEDAEFITKDQYETRLKTDMVAMLEELKTEFEEITISKATVPNEIFWNMGANAMKKEIGTRIQQKINALKADRSENDNT